MLPLVCWYPPQVYRQSMIAQWRALDLDVLLTPMLGPAMDLNFPGKTTGKACCPTIPLTPRLSLVFYEFSPVPNWASGK